LLPYFIRKIEPLGLLGDLVKVERRSDHGTCLASVSYHAQPLKAFTDGQPAAESRANTTIAQEEDPDIWAE
jgi:hypothetical protein